jgi:hypothetical protein
MNRRDAPDGRQVLARTGEPTKMKDDLDDGMVSSAHRVEC